MCVSCLGLAFLASLVDVLAGAVSAAIVVRALRSWVDVRLPFGLDAFVTEVSEPVLGPIRRALPSSGGADFSPFVALVLVQVARQVLHGLLPPVV